MISYIACGGNSTLSNLTVSDASLPIEYVYNSSTTQMYSGLSLKAAYELESQNYTYNSHYFGLTPYDFNSDYNLSMFWTYTAVSKIPNLGTAFIASIEA